jgi:cell wall-associated NlpC family hydrolase
LADLGDELDAPNSQPHPDSPTPALSGSAERSTHSRRERRAQEGAAATPAIPRAAVPVKRESSLVARGAATTAAVKRRFTPTKRGLASAFVMTLAAGLIATMALPAYAFGNGNAGFDAKVSAVAAGDVQTLTVDDASAALAVSRDAYQAPTLEELEAARQAAAAAVAATQAAAQAAAQAALAAETPATQAATDDSEAASAPTSGTFAVNPPSGPYSGQAVVDFAEQFVGVVPYSAGASPEEGFGCDGLTQYVFGQFGIYLPRIVGNQAAMGIRIAPEDAQPGDLVVWPMYHVGIYDGAGGVIDSPDWGRYVSHRALWGSYYFVRIV